MLSTIVSLTVQNFDYISGAVMDLGMSSQARAFLPSTELPSGVSLEDLVEGQTMLVNVLDTGGGDRRVIRLSAKLAPIEAATDTNLADLMPGTIVSAQPLKPTAQGIFVTVGNCSFFVHPPTTVKWEIIRWD